VRRRPAPARRQRRYRLGWRIVALNAVLVETSDLLRLVRPELRALVGRYGETVHVAVWDGRPVCVDARSGRLSTSIPPFTVGADLPAHSTALGKVLLAGRPADEITRFLSEAPNAEDIQAGLGTSRPRASRTRSRSTGRGPARSPRRSSIGTRASSRRSACPSPSIAGGAAGLGYRSAVVAVASHLARCSGQLRPAAKLVPA
jgi:DNA-binding IclR family transcriptional regulator